MAMSAIAIFIVLFLSSGSHGRDIYCYEKESLIPDTMSKNEWKATVQRLKEEWNRTMAPGSAMFLVNLQAALELHWEVDKNFVSKNRRRHGKEKKKPTVKIQLFDHPDACNSTENCTLETALERQFDSFLGCQMCKGMVTLAGGMMGASSTILRAELGIFCRALILPSLTQVCQSILGKLPKIMHGLQAGITSQQICQTDLQVCRSLLFDDTTAYNHDFQTIHQLKVRSSQQNISFSTERALSGRLVETNPIQYGCREKSTCSLVASVDVVGLQLHSSFSCQICINIAKITYGLMKKGENALKNKLNTVCRGLIVPSLSELCFDWVRNVPQIMEKLLDGISVKEVCQIHLQACPTVQFDAPHNFCKICHLSAYSSDVASVALYNDRFFGNMTFESLDDRDQNNPKNFLFTPTNSSSCENISNTCELRQKQGNLHIQLSAIFECQACTMLVKGGESVIGMNNYTLKEHLLLLCEGLTMFEGMCKSIAMEHAETIVELVAKGWSPRYVCTHFLKSCDTVSLLVLDDEAECNTCALSAYSYDIGVVSFRVFQKLRAPPVITQLSPELLEPDKLLRQEYTEHNVVEAFQLGANEKERNLNGLRWLAERSLIYNAVSCDDAECHDDVQMTLSWEHQKHTHIWWCPACKIGVPHREQPISRAQSPLFHSYFDHTHLGTHRVVLHLWLWANNPQMSIEQVQIRLGVNKNTVINWNNLARDPCQWWANNLSRDDMGGQGRVVQFYSAEFSRSTIGVPDDERIITTAFVIIERGSDKMMLKTYDDDNRANLASFLVKYIRSETIVTSDETTWDFYAGVAAVQQAIDAEIQLNLAANQHLNAYTFTAVTDDDLPEPPDGDEKKDDNLREITEFLGQLKGTSKKLFTTHIYEYMMRRYYRNNNFFNHVLAWHAAAFHRGLFRMDDDVPTDDDDYLL